LQTHCLPLRSRHLSGMYLLLHARYILAYSIYISLRDFLSSASIIFLLLFARARTHMSISGG
jgi:hypothetical protein